jgi:ABC-2 type transport system permease protein
VTTHWRYPRLYLAFARFDLASEMSFRINFVAKLSVELLWLSMLVMFYELIFQHTSYVAGWDRNSYLFFLGCYYALGGLIEAFFLENCLGFAELVRSGDLDMYLLKPIDEQFLVTCRHLDWSTLPNVLQGVCLMAYSLVAMGWTFDPVRLMGFVALFACGCAMAYSFLLILCSLSVWMVRNTSLMEMWWLFTSLMRYPREIFFQVSWASPVGWFFTLVVPVLLVVSVPADTMVRPLEEPWFIGWMVAAAGMLLYASRRFFRHALGAYRSASS